MDLNVFPLQHLSSGNPADCGKSIIIEGLIGCGKSSLAEAMGAALGQETLIQTEPDERGNANPFLQDFYREPHRWAFTMQMRLLYMRVRAHQLAQWYVTNTPHWAVMDRSVYGDTAFAHLQLKMKQMTEDEFDTYSGMYHTLTHFLPYPNVCIRLLVSPEKSFQRVQERKEKREGRECESVISLEYLTNLDKEISKTLGVLQQQGVTVLEVPWEKDRPTEEERFEAAKEIVGVIQRKDIRNTFLDLHRRSM